jgi:putative ABC transport system permease protein
MSRPMTMLSKNAATARKMTGAIRPIARKPWMRQDALYRELKRTPRVASVTVKDAMVQSFYDTIAENQRTIQAFNIAFAIAIVIGVVYNTARISLAAEVSAILLGELAVLTLVAIPAGLVMGYRFAALSAMALDTELYRIPLVVSRQTYGFAAAVVLAAAIVSGLIVRRKVDKLDMLAVLKAPE